MPSRDSDPGLGTGIDVDLPDTYFGYAYAFAALADDVPLLLLPVRLETRFQLDGQARELVVRIYPDDVHADTHVPGLQPASQTGP